VYRWRRHGAFVFGVALMAFGLAPVLNILPLNQVLAERFLYFPSIGFALLIALAVVWGMRRWRPVVIGAFAALLMTFAVRSVARSLDWKDERTLFSKTVETSGDSARARTSLGASLYKEGKVEQALQEFVKATELNPSYAPGWSGRARAEGDLGRIDEALEHIAVAIELDPDDALLYHHLGVLQFRAREYNKAAESFRHALDIQPRHAHARFNLGLALYQVGDFDGAVREFGQLENKDIDFPNAWLFIAESETRRGNTPAAAEAARRFLAVYNTDDALAARAREISGQP
jgi:tetratricopeptide (TPR) repeat protein